MARIKQLDSLRGIAVLGLILLNIYFFSIFESGYVGSISPPVSDVLIDYLNVLLFDGRFRALFCMLFGAALVIQFNKQGRSDFLKPRLKLLVVFGVLHGIFIWPGDILLSYGLAGFIALSYLQRSDATLLRHGMLMILISGLLLLLLTGDEPTIYRDTPEFEDILNSAPNTLLGLLVHNIKLFVIMLFMLPILTLWNALGVMLIGMLCYRHSVFHKGLPAPVLSRLLVAVAVLSVMSGVIKYVGEARYAYFVDAIIWANAVIGGLLIAHVNAHMSIKSVISVRLQAVGKLALTCYLMQSIMMVLYFTWLNSNARIEFNRIDYIQLALIVIILQLLLAPIYLKYFKQGPFEWLLRVLTNKQLRRLEY